MENAKKYFFGPLASSAEVMTFWVMHYIEAKNIFSQCGVYGYQKMQNTPYPYTPHCEKKMLTPI
jgi:hypothetical protein